jgi:hypothetical protein
VAAGNIDLNVVVRNEQALGKLNRNLDQASKSSLNLGRAAKLAAGALATIGVGAALRGIVQTTAAFQDLRTSLSSVTGSAREGAEAFRFITEFATQTQFSVEDLSRSFIKLKAAGIEPSQELLTLFTDTAAITTDQIGTLEAVTDLFARTVSGGLGLEEIQRLGDRGVPVLRILEEQLGLTRNQISEYGKTAEGAQKITEAFAKGIRQEFGGATEALLGNLNVAFSNLGIQIRTASDLFGQGLTPVIKDATDDLTKFIQENEKLIESLGKGLGEAVVFTIRNVEALTFAFTALFAVFGKSPIGRIVSGLTALTIFGKEVIDKIGLATEKVKEFIDEQKGIEKYKDVFDFDDQSASIGTFSKTVRAAVIDTGDFAEELQNTNRAIYKQKEETEKLNAEMARLKKEMEDNFYAAVRLERSFEQNALYAALKQVTDQGTLLEMQTAVLVDTFTTFGNTAASELTDVIFQTKRLDEALGNIVEATLRSLIQGFIQLGITILVLEPFEKWLRGVLGRQKEINRELKQEIGLRTILALFTGGGGFGIPFFANGGNISGGQPAIVGERGPELFVPNTSGEIISNSDLTTPTQSGITGQDSEGVTINFNISTVDARGFDELLTTRQELIISLINRGLTERGRARLV